MLATLGLREQLLVCFDPRGPEIDHLFQNASEEQKLANENRKKENSPEERAEEALKETEKNLKQIEELSEKAKNMKEKLESALLKLPLEWKVRPDEEQLEKWLKLQENARMDTGALEGLQVEAEGFRQLGVGKPGDSKEHRLTGKVAIGGESWDFGFERKRGSFYVLRKSDDPEISIMLPASARRGLTRENLSDSLKGWAERAVKYRESELRDEAGMSRGFEITDGEPLAYIELADLSDETTNRISQDHYGFPQMLAKRYNTYMPPEGKIDGSKGDTIGKLRQCVKMIYEKGIKTYYLHVVAHGTEKEILFGEHRVPPAQLTSLFEEFPDCRFTVNVISCFGGGLAKEMQQFKDHQDAKEGRVTVFTQTKGDVLNYAANTGEDYSTLYNAALVHYLMQGIDGRPGKRLTYGQAHLRADYEAKQGGFTDAEVHKSRPNEGSLRTAAYRPGLSEESFLSA